MHLLVAASLVACRGSGRPIHCWRRASAAGKNGCRQADGAGRHYLGLYLRQNRSEFTTGWSVCTDGDGEGWLTPSRRSSRCTTVSFCPHRARTSARSDLADGEEGVRRLEDSGSPRDRERRARARV